jgi:hypothetical protein
MKLGRLEINLKWHRKREEWYCPECGKLDRVMYACMTHGKMALTKHGYDAYQAALKAPRESK